MEPNTFQSVSRGTAYSRFLVPLTVMNSGIRDPDYMLDILRRSKVLETMQYINRPQGHKVLDSFRGMYIPCSKSR